MKRLFTCVLIFLSFNSFIFSQEKIDLESLDDKNLEELYLMRNTVFARHGRPFKTHELNTYFRNQDWYKMDLDFSDTLLSDIDIENVNTILTREQELLKNNYITENEKIRINFDNIVNRRQFGMFSDADIEKLRANGFVVVPAAHEQLFYLYEKNSYKGIANFVTTDAVLQLYHIFYDFTLRRLEMDRLYPIIKTLTSEMMRLSLDAYNNTSDEKVREAALRNIAFFTVPNYFLTGDTTVFHPIAAELIRREIEKCERANSRLNSLIFNPRGDAQQHNIDYTQFIPRGHYTRSPELTRYFKAMMWFGQNYFLTYEEYDIIQALLITQQLYNNEVEGERLIDLWMTIYKATEFYVGAVDDPGPPEYMYILLKLFGDKPNLDDFSDEVKLIEAKRMAKDLSQMTRIKVQMVGIPNSAQFRFMGQRYIPDSEIMQRLTKWPERPFPSGLDVAAVLGSAKAQDLQLNEYKEGEKWSDYPDSLAKLIKEYSELEPHDWRQNLYYSWVWCLKSLLEPVTGAPYPFFMQNDAWQVKSLTTSLASWAELRHDIILYGKGVAAESGNGEYWAPDPPKGYVEPNVTFYRRLGELLSFTKKGLQEKELLTQRMEKKFKKFSELVEFLLTVSRKELDGEALTIREYKRIWYIGGLIEGLTISVIADKNYLTWYQLISEVDKNIAVIADVATSLHSVLEVGVGPAYEIYTVVDIDGYLKLTRGAVFTYYEFTHPASDRLTDKQWQEMLKSGEQPSLPEWTKPCLSDQPSHEVPRPKYVYYPIR